jgi:hypothetical protein
MQGYRCMMVHDVTMTQKQKRTSNYLIGVFSGSLQSTPLTRDLAPRSTLVWGERVGETIESSRFMLTFPDLNVDLFFSTPLTKILAHVDDDDLQRTDLLG